MLFNSYPFVFLFLPAVLLGYFALGRVGNLAPVIWLALASLAFYSFSNGPFVALLLGSIAFNYLIGLLLIAGKLRSDTRLAVLTLGVAGDLLILGIVKYAGFLAANLNTIFASHFTINICCRSASPSTPSPRSRSWSTLTKAMSPATRCRITRCSSLTFRI
jgi:alginate O-acetyltransferase complex protein AlgI